MEYPQELQTPTTEEQLDLEAGPFLIEAMQAVNDIVVILKRLFPNVPESAFDTLVKSALPRMDITSTIIQIAGAGTDNQTITDNQTGFDNATWNSMKSWQGYPATNDPDFLNYYPAPNKTWRKLDGSSNTNTGPVAENVTVMGSRKVGEKSVAYWEYSDIDGDLESGSSVQWFYAEKATPNTRVAIAGATNKELTNTSSLLGKIYGFSVIPRSATGVPNGAEVFSNFVEAEASGGEPYVSGNPNDWTGERLVMPFPSGLTDASGGNTAFAIRPDTTSGNHAAFTDVHNLGAMNYDISFTVKATNMDGVFVTFISPSQQKEVGKEAFLLSTQSKLFNTPASSIEMIKPDYYRLSVKAEGNGQPVTMAINPRVGTEYEYTGDGVIQIEVSDFQVKINQ